jgi:hypothetical protein
VPSFVLVRPVPQHGDPGPALHLQEGAGSGEKELLNLVPGCPVAKLVAFPVDLFEERGDVGVGEDEGCEGRNDRGATGPNASSWPTAGQTTRLRGDPVSNGDPPGIQNSTSTRGGDSCTGMAANAFEGRASDSKTLSDTTAGANASAAGHAFEGRVIQEYVVGGH